MTLNKVKLKSKFNIIISLALIILISLVSYLTYLRETRFVEKVGLDNARDIANVIVTARNYIASVTSASDEPANNYNLVPQVAATNIAKLLTEGREMYVRQVSLRYRNPENRPDAYETERLKEFDKEGAGAREKYSIVEMQGIKTFRYLLPMTATKYCLKCHSSYESAPPFVQERFPPGHPSYNYKLGQVIGAVSVRTPTSDLYREIGTALWTDIAFFGLIILIIMIILGVLLNNLIIRPVSLLSLNIKDVLETGNFAAKVKPKTGDEIGQLISNFNEMLDELDRREKQHTEAEERYRKFIEKSGYAVAVFLNDGKIVMTNQNAEQMLGLPKDELLGKVIFDFFEDGEGMKRGVAGYISEGAATIVNGATYHKLKSSIGLINVEMTITSSRSGVKAGQEILFTAIFKLPEKSR